jgi:hypothetical protein
LTVVGGEDGEMTRISRSPSTALAMAVAMAGAATARADTIDFSQFGAEGTHVVDGSSGVTADGIAFVISGGYGHLTVFDQGGLWTGAFTPGAALLCNCAGPGAITIDFAAPVTDLSLGAQTNDNGAYVATLTAYDAGHAVLRSLSVNGVSANAPGTVPILALSQSGTWSVTISSTNDGDGFALGGVPGAGGPAVPEPSAWAMMLLGFGLAGASLRRRTRFSRSARPAWPARAGAGH